MSVMLYPCILCDALLIDLLWCVFVNCLMKQLAKCLSVVIILFLNVMGVFSVVEVLCWIGRVWSSRECACCTCDPTVHLSVPSIGFVYVFCMSEVIFSFKSLRAGS